MDFFQFASYAELFVTFSMDANGDVANNYWICLLVGGLCFLIVYVFQVFGLWTIAKREGYKNKWMIFIPFLNTYYIGVCSQKNKVYGVNAKAFAIGTAVLEALLVAGYIIYYVAVFSCWNYIDWQPRTYGNTEYWVIGGFRDNMPASLNWLGWMFMYGNDYILSWVELVFIIVKLLLLTAFFRTYSAPRYLLFSVVGAILPLQGILIYAVRNNTGMNYMEYIRRVRERNYRMYQQQYGNPYNNNPYNNNPYGGQPGSQGSAPDPFDEYGSSGGQNASGQSGSADGSPSSGSSSSGSDSPFDDFK